MNIDLGDPLLLSVSYDPEDMEISTFEDFFGLMKNE
jgi:hypothetical protein